MSVLSDRPPRRVGGRDGTGYHLGLEARKLVMGVEKNKDLVRRFYDEVWDKGHVDVTASKNGKTEKLAVNPQTGALMQDKQDRGMGILFTVRHAFERRGKSLVLQAG